MDLAKASDCIPHVLFIAKMHAYGFSKEVSRILLFILKKEKQKTLE